jgi:hypothetical protein
MTTVLELFDGIWDEISVKTVMYKFYNKGIGNITAQAV